jgi:hypothetical protein
MKRPHQDTLLPCSAGLMKREINGGSLEAEMDHTKTRRIPGDTKSRKFSEFLLEKKNKYSFEKEVDAEVIKFIEL